MTMHVRDFDAVAPVKLDAAFVARAPVARKAPRAANLTIVVPDVLDGVNVACDSAGLKGGAKLIATIGMLLLIAL